MMAFLNRCILGISAVAASAVITSTAALAAERTDTNRSVKAVQRMQWPDVNQPLRTDLKAPNEAAVVVSVESYLLLAEGANVPYANRDGDGMANFLVYTRGVPGANVHRLQDKKASREMILEAVDQALKEAKDGTVWFYFAGHGAAADDRGQLLLGVDTPANEKLMTSRAVSLKELQEKVEKSQVDQAIFIIDACAAELGSRFAVPVSLSLKSPKKKIAIWSAVDEGEKSGYIANAKHGAFTYAALGALRGWADGEICGSKDKIVSAEEAQAYVSRFLKTNEIRDQNPKMLTSVDFVLSSSVEEAAPELTKGSVRSDGQGKVRRDRSQKGAFASKKAPEKSSTPLIVTASATAVSAVALGVGGYFLFVRQVDDEDKRDAVMESLASGDRTLSSAKSKWESYDDDVVFDGRLGMGLMIGGAALGLASALGWIYWVNGDDNKKTATNFTVQPGFFALSGTW